MRSHAAKKCNDCHKVQCDCEDVCDNVISREDILHDFPKECVTVCGDHDADPLDEVIIVFSRADDAGNPTTSTVNLPCPEKLDCADTITVVAVDGPVVVKGLQNEDQGGTGTVTIEAGGQATFRAITPPGSNCNCECPFFLVCLCPPLLQSGAAAAARAGNVRRMPARRR